MNWIKILISAIISLPFTGLSANNNQFIEVEKYILENKIDSARLCLEKAKSKSTDYISVLESILNGNYNYQDQYRFVESIRSRIKVDQEALNNYLEEKIEVPNDESFNLHYVRLKFAHISNLRNDNKIAQATEINGELENYISQFDANQEDVRRAKLYVLIHGMVVAYIQQKGNESQKLGLQILEEAKQLSDSQFIIAAYHHLFSAYRVNGNLEKSIESVEKAREIDEILAQRSPYYFENLFFLADAYMYQGGKLKEVKEITEIIYQDPTARPRSYELIARYLREIEILKSEPEQEYIFNMMGVNSILEFAEQAKEKTEGILYDYDQYYVYNETAYTLKEYKEYDKAMEFMTNAVKVTRKVYGEDLANSLADFETEQIRKEKEIAIAYEKEKNSLYILIASLVGALSIISIIAFIRKRKQTILLRQKGKEVEEALHEKQLLLKEVHHRVKNNFQIISSLLELQSKGIEDEKAKELAHEGRNRVKSMALIHQKLYQNDELLIYFDDYIDKLVKEISSMYGSGKHREVSIEVPEIAFDIDTAIPLGLIINELVTNAYKYGSNEDESKLSVSIKALTKGDYKLEVKDNGNGMPINFDLSKAKSLGLRLVKSLSKQLHGSVSYSNDNGAVFSILFKNSATRALAE